MYRQNGKRKILKSSQLISFPIKDSLKEIATTPHWIWCTYLDRIDSRIDLKERATSNAERVIE